MLRSGARSNYLRYFATLGVAITALTFSTSVRADNWATRLGYPEDAKVLILHAHGMGMCYETNAAAGKLLEEKVISSASAMPPCPWFANAAEWRGEHPKADVGLEFTINSPLPQYRWKNLSQDEFVRSLIDRDGYQWPRVIQVMVTASAEDVEHELRMQILHAERHGLRPTHFTTSLGALYSRPDLADVYLRISREQWIPAVVIELTPALAEGFREQGFPVPDEMIRSLEDYPFPKIQDLKIVPRTKSLEEKIEGTVKMLADLPPGLTQIACAPADDSPALRALDPNWQQRVWDAEVWNSDEVKAELAKKDVVITTWQEVMQRFDGSN
ncbi:polysaccharide deacetylase family protein [Aeoliella sp. SH292]|uniref:polysaccharide deacetylase family protein n=1 Tax=Aeoliella sp. SH292 TaxID=3454464 RepID=UPI003F9B3D05